MLFFRVRPAAGEYRVNALQQKMKSVSHWIVVAVIAGAGVAHATDLVIYDESLENGFSTDDSYFGGLVVGSTAQAHSGSKSIALTGQSGANAFNALAFTGTTSYSTDTYPVFHFWIYGSAPGAQNFDVEVYANRNSGVPDKSASLNSYISGGAIANGTWREVTVNLTQPPLSYTGTIDRIDIQSESSSAQTTIYLDDISLQSSVVDEIFANSFEGGTTPPPTNGLVEDHNITYDTFTSDRFTWYDSAGKQRIAVLAHNDFQTYAGSHGGELREFVYQTAAGALTVTAPVRDDSSDGGFGYIVSHPASEGHCVGGDSSSLGHQFAGLWTRVFEGRHHAIFRFSQMYPRYCGTTAAAEHDIPVTIDWSFSTGHDNVLWSVTYDMSAIGANVLDDDSRAPYGTMNIDGSSGPYMDNNVAGIRWGDRYQFITQPLPGTLAQLNNPWDWRTSNTIPFVELWTSNDGTMGLVQTQTMSQQDAGGGRIPPSDGTYDVSVYWNKQSSQGQACPDGSIDQQTVQAHSLPCVGFWPYQANSFSYGGVAEPVNDAKMTWGTQYGFLGQSTYDLHDSTLPAGSTAPGYPRKSYAVYVVFGQHSAGPVNAEIARSNALTTMTVTASTGQVVTSGPGGAGRTDNVAYSPAGYDPVYGAIVFNAAANDVIGNVSVSSALKNPLVVVRNYTAGTYPTVKVAGSTLTPDVDYFASLRSDQNEIWITLNRTLTGSTSLQITH
jgi:hypothetical protein